MSDDRVGDVDVHDLAWAFVVRFNEEGARLRFVFKSRADANVSRRVMKDILARTTSVSAAIGEEGGPQMICDAEAG